MLKFVSFISKNNDIPYIVKKCVFEAVLMSTLLYGCESWTGADMKPMAKLCNWCLKQLLDVRKFTCNDVCYAESGYPPLKDRIVFEQHTFYRKMWQERSVYDGDLRWYISMMMIYDGLLWSINNLSIYLSIYLNI